LQHSHRTNSEVGTLTVAPAAAPAAAAAAADDDAALWLMKQSDNPSATLNLLYQALRQSV